MSPACWASTRVDTAGAATTRPSLCARTLTCSRRPTAGRSSGKAFFALDKSAGRHHSAATGRWSRSTGTGRPVSSGSGKDRERMDFSSDCAGFHTGFCHRRAGRADRAALHPAHAEPGTVGRAGVGAGRGHGRRLLRRHRRLWPDADHAPSWSSSSSGWRWWAALFLCYLGVRTLSRQPGAQRAANSEAKGVGGAYMSTFLLTITNPMTILAFVAIFAGAGLADGGRRCAGRSVDRGRRLSAAPRPGGSCCRGAYRCCASHISAPTVLRLGKPRGRGLFFVIFGVLAIVRAFVA